MPVRPAHRRRSLVTPSAVIEEHDAAVAKSRRQHFDGRPPGAPRGRGWTVDDQQVNVLREYGFQRFAVVPDQCLAAHYGASELSHMDLGVLLESGQGESARVRSANDGS